MILKQGEKVHIISRRRFETDLRRHFIGEVLVVDGTMARIRGYAFVLDASVNQYVRKPEKRIRIVGLADEGNIINVLPADAHLDHAKYALSPEKNMVVTDGKTFSLDINEFGLTK